MHLLANEQEVGLARAASRVHNTPRHSPLDARPIAHMVDVDDERLIAVRHDAHVGEVGLLHAQLELAHALVTQVLCPVTNCCLILENK